MGVGLDREVQAWLEHAGHRADQRVARDISSPEVALVLVVPEARKRIAEKFVDDTELYDEELEEALKYATGAA